MALQDSPRPADNANIVDVAPTKEYTMIASPLAAQREAQARCRRDGGPLNTVDAPSLGDWSFTGSPYDALNVAKDIVWNGLADDVRLTTDEGRVMTRDEIAAARY